MGLRIVLAGLLLAVPSVCIASGPGTVHLTWDTAYSCYKSGGRYHGVATGPGIALDLGETIGIRGRYLSNWYSSAGPDFQVQEASGGLVVRLDVFKYIPWMDLGAAYRFAQASERVQANAAGISVGFGVDRLLDREWYYGGFTYLQKLSNEEAMPAVTTLGIRLGYRWSYGDPF